MPVQVMKALSSNPTVPLSNPLLRVFYLVEWLTPYFIVTGHSTIPFAQDRSRTQVTVFTWSSLCSLVSNAPNTSPSHSPFRSKYTHSSLFSAFQLNFKSSIGSEFLSMGSHGWRGRNRIRQRHDKHHLESKAKMTVRGVGVRTESAGHSLSSRSRAPLSYLFIHPGEILVYLFRGLAKQALASPLLIG